MKNIDEQDLSALWQQQQPPTGLAQTLTARINRHRRAAAVRHFVEVTLTIAGATLLLWPGGDGSLSPNQWLLIPFFAVFLVVSWTLIVQQRLTRRVAASEPVAVYVRLRLLQLRGTLRDLRLLSGSAIALGSYGLLVLMVVYVIGADAWLDAAIRLVAWSSLWGAGTWVLVTRRRRMTLCEYRAVRRVASSRG